MIQDFACPSTESRVVHCTLFPVAGWSPLWERQTRPHQVCSSLLSPFTFSVSVGLYLWAVMTSSGHHLTLTSNLWRYRRHFSLTFRVPPHSAKVWILELFIFCLNVPFIHCFSPNWTRSGSFPEEPEEPPLVKFSTNFQQIHLVWFPTLTVSARCHGNPQLD